MIFVLSMGDCNSLFERSVFLGSFLLCGVSTIGNPLKDYK